ncbi:MAG TPA: hypothetical protein VFV52_09505 [Bacilli bacterium]|nr:hypothetical protein [Bacilli bacterium]
MSERFDVTYIRGRRDVSDWKRASREIDLLLRSPQVDEDVMRARTAHAERRQDSRLELFPNAIYFGKGRDRK